MKWKGKTMKYIKSLLVIAALALFLAATSPASANVGYPFQSLKTDKCLTPFGGLVTDNTNIVQFDCNGSASQRWATSTDPQGRPTIVDVGTFKCLTPYGGKIAKGEDLVEYTCNGDDSQSFYWDNGQIGMFWSNNPMPLGEPDECLTIEGGSYANNARLTLWPCDPNNEYQQFLLG